METIIIRCIIIYFLMSTFILLNLLFNNKISFYIEDLETGEIKQPPISLYIFISLSWIIIIPLILIKKVKE